MLAAQWSPLVTESCPHGWGSRLGADSHSRREAGPKSSPANG